MKKLLATTAIAVIGMAGAASAQSVLERVLSETDSLNEVTGIFANTADNIGASGFGTTSTEEVAVTVKEGDVISVDDGSGTNTVTGTVQADGTLQDADGNTVEDNAGANIVVALGAQLRRDGDGTNTVDDADITASDAEGLASDAVFQTVSVDSTTAGIDGSLNITAGRIDEATANVGDQVTSISSVTTNFGNMASTVLGAVNTGEIGLGTSQDVEEAVADTSEAVRSVVTQVGTTAGETVLAVNSALNTMGVDGSINVDLDGVDASVAAVSPDVLEIVSGSTTDADGNVIETGVIDLAGIDQLLGSMETTVLGAVNTGTIVSGVDNQVQGTVAQIVGNSATNMFGEAAE